MELDFCICIYVNIFSRLISATGKDSLGTSIHSSIKIWKSDKSWWLLVILFSGIDHILPRFRLKHHFQFPKLFFRCNFLLGPNYKILGHQKDFLRSKLIAPSWNICIRYLQQLARLHRHNNFLIQVQLQRLNKVAFRSFLKSMISCTLPVNQKRILATPPVRSEIFSNSAYGAPDPTAKEKTIAPIS